MKKSELKIGDWYRIDYDDEEKFLCDGSVHEVAQLKKIYGIEYWFESPIDNEYYFVGLDDIKYEADSPKPITFDQSLITRLTVVGPEGREFEKWFDKAEFSIQDGGRTIKIFYK